MNLPEPQPVVPTPSIRWFQPTPGRLVMQLLLLESLLLGSEWLRWFPEGWPVLIAVAAVGLAIMLILLWWAAALAFRWRYTFSIRSLLVFMLACAIACSWFAVKIQQAKKQRDAVRVIEAAGGEVWCDVPQHDCRVRAREEREFPSLLPTWLRFDLFYPMSHVSFTRKDLHAYILIIRDDLAVSPELLMHVAELRHLRYLNLSGTNVGDACLEPLSKLHELEQLGLFCTHVTEAGVARLKEVLPSVQIAWGWGGWYKHGYRGALYRSDTGEGSSECPIAGERELRSVDLRFCTITEADLIRFKEWTRLENLVLHGTNVTDAGLEHLKGLARLQKLDLTETKVTSDGVKNLQQALPKCKITWSPPTSDERQSPAKPDQPNG